MILRYRTNAHQLIKRVARSLNQVCVRCAVLVYLNLNLESKTNFFFLRVLQVHQVLFAPCIGLDFRYGLEPTNQNRYMLQSDNLESLVTRS